MEFKKWVFPDLSKHYNSHKWLCERVILAPKNETVSTINHEVTVIKSTNHLIQSLMKVKLSSIQQSSLILLSQLELLHIFPEGWSPNNASKRFRSS